MDLIYHNGIQPFIQSLQKSSQYKLLRQIDLLEKYGHQLGMPHVRKIDDNLYELRSRGSQEVRILFCFYNQQCYLLHAFIKKTQKTPMKEIQTAIKRKP